MRTVLTIRDFFFEYDQEPKEHAQVLRNRRKAFPFLYDHRLSPKRRA